MISSSFARAEAVWLQPPEYRPTPDDIDQDLQQVRKDIEKLTCDFAEEYCGEVEESSDVEVIITAAKTMISLLNEKAAEMTELEESLSCFPDPDAEYDNRDFGDGE